MKKFIFLFSVMSVLVLVSACVAQPTATPPPPTEGQEIPIVTEAPTLPAETPAPIITEEPTVQATEIVHLVIPGNAVIDKLQEISDCNTGERIGMGTTTFVGSGCDQWSISRIERPVKALNDSYNPALDIIRAYMGQDEIWYYASIRLNPSASGNIPSELTISLELDNNLNSRGDYLVIATGFGSEWSTDGVQVWQDTNNDVGGDLPHKPGEPIGDGYDTLIFNAGVGDDADLVWSRINPDDGAVLEIAFKKDLMPTNQVFAWWVWTSLNQLNADHKEVVDARVDAESWSMDNTCGWIFGASPSTQLLNLCETPATSLKSTPTSPPSSSDECKDCNTNNPDPTDPDPDPDPHPTIPAPDPN